MANIIRQLREKHSLTQDELAKKLGVTRQTLIRYEADAGDLSAEMIQKLSKIFDVPYSCLIDNKMPAEPEYAVVGTEKKGGNTGDAHFHTGGKYPQIQGSSALRFGQSRRQTECRADGFIQTAVFH